MTLDLEVIRNRIATAESERDGWRVAGHQENYRAAYMLVEALELQLDERLRQAARR